MPSNPPSAETMQRIIDATNAAAYVADAAKYGLEREDLINLMVNLTIYLARHPAADILTDRPARQAFLDAMYDLSRWPEGCQDLLAALEDATAHYWF